MFMRNNSQMCTLHGNQTAADRMHSYTAVVQNKREKEKKNNPKTPNEIMRNIQINGKQYKI